MIKTYATKVEFGILSPEIIKKCSVLHVTSHDLYEKGNPKVGGLCDLRLGTIDRQYICQTCFGDIINCPGHFGHIELHLPVYHVSFIKTLYKILQTVCFFCSEILDSDIKCKFSGEKQFKYVHEKCKNKYECYHCNQTQPKITFDSYKIYYQINDEKEILQAKDAYNVLRKLSNKNICLLGFKPSQTHPKDMIINFLPVSPPQVRPSVTMDSFVRSQDDLTHKLCEIIRANHNVKRHENNPDVSQEFHNLVQFHISTLIDNEIPGQPQATQRTSRPIKSITQRLKAKGGRIRGNLMGKRVNFSARTVITADPHLELDELGVPFEIASNMTFPDVVTPFNKSILMEYIQNGPDCADVNKVGAKYIIKKNGVKKDIRFTSNLELEIGDTVERHMKTGDLVLFNRQPTLHKMSMMGHRVKVMKNSTFRMNLSVTTPYNADFDGDEMNIHFPQSLAAKSELKELMMVPHNIVSAQANKPVIGIVQDALLASWLLTNKDTFLDIHMIHNIVCNANYSPDDVPLPVIHKPRNLWTGKQIFNLLFPNDFHYGKNSDIDDTQVVIRDGYYVSGRMTKKYLGSSDGGIIHKLWLEYSHDITNTFISKLQFIVNYWVQHYGFSIGVPDIYLDIQTQKKTKTIIDDSVKKVKQILKTNLNHESKVNEILNNAMAMSGKCVQDAITFDNKIHCTVSAGSKGSVLNIAQIMACVGQQNVNGGRLTEGYTNRVIPHFERHDLSPEAKGFVKNSYFSGLDPSEFFFHAMGGREGVIDTAVKTSETGYIQRRLIKAMEDLKVYPDLTVRNSIGNIVQFVYGDDGFDGSQLYTHQGMRIPFLFKTRPHDTKNDVKTVETFIDEMIPKYRYVEPFKHIKTHLGVCLAQVKLTDELHEEIRYNLHCALVKSGEMVGTIAAQSLGEVVTQLTLNTFHSAGISAKNITLGVPRFKEIINVSKNIKSPSMSVRTKSNHKSADFIANKIEYCIIDNLINKKFMSKERSQSFKSHADYVEVPQIYETSIHFHFDIALLKKYNITLFDLYLKLVKDYEEDVIVTYTHENIDPNMEICFVDEEAELNDRHIFVLMNKLLYKFAIKGNMEIKKVFTKQENDGWTIETDGIDMNTIFQIPEFDGNTCISNDVLNVYETLGIEAARSILFDELKKVVEFDGSYINRRHFYTLIDTMTHKGDVMSITRHGINRTDVGPLMKCSFEETVDILTDAAIYSETDNLSGVTEKIIMGKLTSVGTGDCEIMYNAPVMSKNESFLLTTPDSSEMEYEESYYPDEIESYFPIT